MKYESTGPSFCIPFWHFAAILYSCRTTAYTITALLLFGWEWPKICTISEMACLPVTPAKRLSSSTQLVGGAANCWGVLHCSLACLLLMVPLPPALWSILDLLSEWDEDWASNRPHCPPAVLEGRRWKRKLSPLSTATSSPFPSYLEKQLHEDKKRKV